MQYKCDSNLITLNYNIQFRSVTTLLHVMAEKQNNNINNNVLISYEECKSRHLQGYMWSRHWF